MNKITEQSEVQSSPRISLADLGGEAVILDVESGQYYGLNAVGHFVLSQIETPVLVSEVLTQVAARYGIEESAAQADVLAFLDEMNEAGLILVEK